MSGDRPVIALRDVTVRRAGQTILGPVTWDVREGERWAVIGRNGSGKTTLASVAAMHLWPTSGTVDLLGERYGRTDARDLWRRVGLASSSVEGTLRPDLTPHVLIMTARHGATEPWWHVYDDADHARASLLAARFGLAAHEDQAFETLSAGERRRTSIARALMPDPDVLILDEPAANLDLTARELLLRDLTELATTDRPRAIVLVTHHLEEIPAGFAHGLALADGQVVGAGPLEDVLRDDVLEATYGIRVSARRAGGRWSATLQG